MSLWLSPSGRLSAHRKGISKSALPYRRTPPSWLKVNPGEVTEHVCKLARKGLTPSQIGVILRDSHGIAQVAHVTGSKILRILKKNGASRTVRATGAGGQSSSRSAAAGARSLMHRPACPAGHAVRLSLSSARGAGGRRAQGRHDRGRACRLQKAAGGAPHRL